MARAATLRVAAGQRSAASPPHRCGTTAFRAVHSHNRHSIRNVAQQSINQPSVDTTAALVLAAAVLTAGAPPAATAFALHPEPGNALSLPTWAIHVSSVAEWVVAMGLMWRYAEVSRFPAWKGMAWGMLPALGSAMAACTWHFFYNAPSLDWLVALQVWHFTAPAAPCHCTCLVSLQLHAAAHAPLAGHNLPSMLHNAAAIASNTPKNPGLPHGRGQLHLLAGGIPHIRSRSGRERLWPWLS